MGVVKRKKVTTLQRAMTKKVVSFFGGRGMGDTNVSDATGRLSSL